MEAGSKKFAGIIVRSLAQQETLRLWKACQNIHLQQGVIDSYTLAADSQNLVDATRQLTPLEQQDHKHVC
jgi:hypothetical protein